MKNCKTPCQSAELAKLKRQQTESIALLQQLSTQVGVVFGEMIDEHISMLNGRKHNSMNWDMKETNGEQ
mgnify:CR=1 FL=1